MKTMIALLTTTVLVAGVATAMAAEQGSDEAPGYALSLRMSRSSGPYASARVPGRIRNKHVQRSDAARLSAGRPVRTSTGASCPVRMAGRKAGHFLSRVSCWSGLRVLFAYDAGYARPFRLRHRLPQNAGNITVRESEQRSGRSLLLQLSAFILLASIAASRRI